MGADGQRGSAAAQTLACSGACAGGSPSAEGTRGAAPAVVPAAVAGGAGIVAVMPTGTAAVGNNGGAWVTVPAVTIPAAAEVAMANAEAGTGTPEGCCSEDVDWHAPQHGWGGTDCGCGMTGTRRSPCAIAAIGGCIAPPPVWANEVGGAAAASAGCPCVGGAIGAMHGLC